ncbi:MAG TPA: carbamoyltransferase [Bacteroidia bacterium]|nr:carbamoyltransferase [Bacteroidia bacterium]HRS58790.1 carbamoyltransferase [Bacteroidia bacterium]HRU68148.1 carbamoyltransferase [Bacteroidia bacterium]
MSSFILGISAFYHDSAAALLADGEIVAAAQEERFTRKKHDSSFPSNAVKYVLSEAGISLKDVEIVAFYDKPFIKFERLLETYHAFAPKGLISFLSAVPVWIKEKLFMRKMLQDEFEKLGFKKVPVIFPEHHLSHAASAFYPSPFQEAAILTIDGVGEWATTTIGYARDNEIKIIKELHFPHSLGLLYSAFTYYTGFKVNSGEYKLMGLAPFGNPDAEQTKKFREIIYQELADVREDGSLLLNMKYFRFATGLTMTYDKKWEKLFGVKRRQEGEPITRDIMNLALAIQQVCEETVIKLAKTTKSLTKAEYLVMAGGVALNSVANGKLLETGLFKDIWIQPAAGDAGGALGAAYLAWHLWKGNKRTASRQPDAMQGAFLGPSFSDNQIRGMAVKYNAKYYYYNDFEELTKLTAEKIAEGKVIGWFQGRMEFGPRALGNRSILADARNPEMQKKLNLKIKFREGFRPFAPSVPEEDIQEYFKLDRPSPYMLLVVPVKSAHLKKMPENYHELPLFERLYFIRSDIPAVTHIDNSARIQSVNKSTNYRFWALINEFKRQTGYSVIVNTSFNVRGEPIVCTPDDAFRCFMRTEMDCLIIGNFFFEKNEQLKTLNDNKWEEKFRSD